MFLAFDRPREDQNQRECHGKEDEISRAVVRNALALRHEPNGVVHELIDFSLVGDLVFERGEVRDGGDAEHEQQQEDTQSSDPEHANEMPFVR